MSGEESGSDLELTLQGALARFRAYLLETSSWLTVDQIGERFGWTSADAAVWIQAHRAAGTLLVVPHGGRDIVPAFQLDDAADGHVDPGVARVMKTLTAAGLIGWQLWEWWYSHSSWLDGQSPVQALETDLALVQRAASNVAGEIMQGRRSVGLS